MNNYTPSHIAQNVTIVFILCILEDLWCPDYSTMLLKVFIANLYC